METDTYFWQLFKWLPDTLFTLLGQPPDQVAAYRYSSEEIKKSYRLDGVFVPKSVKLPVYFLEVQYQRRRHFYSNLFAKVFSYLDANDPEQEWTAIALFANRGIEPKRRRSYRALLASPNVRRMYLDELPAPDDAPPGVKLLRMLTASEDETRELVAQVLRQAEQEPDCERGDRIVELINRLLLRRFPEKHPKELQRMFKLHDIRKSEVWKESHQEGIEDNQRQLVNRWRAEGKSLKEIAELLKIPLAEVRRLARSPKSAD